VGAPYDPGAARHAQASRGALAVRVRTTGARRAATGGRPRPDLGPHFYEPTLLQDVREDMSLFADETFGPVVAISTFATDDEVVERANESVYGLNFSVWTEDTAIEDAVTSADVDQSVDVAEVVGADDRSGVGRGDPRHRLDKFRGGVGLVG
jgi:acyl-CoA reductase-like NAD-dependent aldehyde dehydrogenase